MKYLTKFSVETRLKSRSLESLIRFIVVLVHKFQPKSLNLGIPCLFNFKLWLIIFFHHFIQLIIKGGLPFSFLHLMQRYR